MTRREHFTANVALFAIVVAGVLGFSCGGGGGSSPVPPGLVASFVALADPPSSGSLTLQPGSTSGASFNVRVAATEIDDFFGAAFTINFPSDSVQFVSSDSTGSFLRDGCASPCSIVSFDAKVSAPGQVRVVATRLDAGTNSGIDVVGTRDLVILRFVATDEVTGGSIDFDLTNREVRSSVQPPPEGQPITATWTGGEVSASL